MRKRKDAWPSPELTGALNTLMRPGEPEPGPASPPRHPFHVDVKPITLPGVSYSRELRLSQDGGYSWQTLYLEPQDIGPVIAALQAEQEAKAG